MPFITKDDYGQRLKDTNLVAILGEYPDTSVVLYAAHESAISMATSYLHQWYDTDVVFAATGTSRNLHLVQLCVSIALYHLYQRLPKRVQPEWVVKDYDEAISFLERVSDRKTQLPLQRRIEDGATTANAKFRWGSQISRG